MQCAKTRNWLSHLALVASLSIWAFATSAASKTDTVLFKNGDKLTGEIKSLKRGQLNLNTEATGTIGIEWDKVANVISNQQIQVETTNGARYFGNLASSEIASSIIVVTDGGRLSLDTVDVIVMTPIEGGGIHGLDVDLSIGYNFAKAGGVQQTTLGVNMDYRSLIRIESISFSTVITDSDTQDASKRMNLGLRHTRLWNKRWFTNSSLTFDQNDEFGLNLRTSVGSGGGRYLVQSNTMLLSLEGGLQFSRENLIAEDAERDSLESIFTANWDWFLFEDPELDWSTNLQIIPSLTERGRVRGELNTALSWEVIGDLKWAISLYGSWDNQPQSEVASTTDYGVNTTLVYDF